MNKLLTTIAGTATFTASAFAVVQGDASIGPSGESAGSAEPVLVELFTSQGCSSCPPADALAARIKDEPGLVVITRPVTYWDNLGWKDTLAREDNTRLQRAYAFRGLAGRNGVYTPQMVVNGQVGFVGSSEYDLRRTLSVVKSGAKAAIRARRQPDGGWQVGLGGRAPEASELMLVALKRHATVRIGAGENGDRKIGYSNVVVAERRIDEWSGGEQGVRLTPAQFEVPGADSYALVLRAKNAGPVLAARMIG